MENSTSQFVIDAGNTRLKIAHFQKGELIEVRSFPYDELALLIDQLNKLKSYHTIYSSVIDTELNKQFVHALQPNFQISPELQLPIQLKKYKTPHTLGADRIANSAAAYHLSRKQNSLVIDIGTCIKFDMTNNKGEFLGGSISPGISMRYKSMAQFTGKLPEINSLHHIDFIGLSTEECLNVGVINAITHEIQGFITQYTQRFDNLTIFLTGGDHKIFDNAFKNSIFVDENLTLKGLHLILTHNAH